MELNPQQIKAVNCTDNKILVLAAAGSGKTAVLTERVAKCIEDGIDPKSMLILTFTNAAAFEMRERFKKRMPDCINIPEFRTFHAFCYRLIVKDHMVRTALGYNTIPNIAYEGKLVNIKKEAIMQCGIKLQVKQIDDPNNIKTRADRKQYELYRKAVDRLLKQQNLITFDILCYGVCKLFEDDDPAVFKYKHQYKYLFVDEFQDTDIRQVRFLNSFPEDSTHWWLCGDALQNIYAWRGTSNATLKQLSKDPDWTKIKMDENYRCTNQICKYANQKSKYADKAYRIEMKGHRDGDPVEEIHNAYSSASEPVDVRHITKIAKQLKNITEESAILCRSNKEVIFVSEKLKELGIECTQSHKRSEFKHILQSSIDNDYMLNLLSSHLNSESHADFIRLKSQTNNPDIQWFMNLYGRKEEISKLAQTIIDVRNILNEHSSNATKVKKIEKIEKLKIKIDNKEIERLTPYALVEYLLNKIEEAQNSSIYVGTIHSVKGLEFPHVYVMGVNDFRFRIDNEEMDLFCLRSCA